MFLSENLLLILQDCKNGRSLRKLKNTSSADSTWLCWIQLLRTAIDLILTRSIWLHPWTLFDITGVKGSLLRNIGFVLKWSLLLLSHFWILLMLIPVQCRLILEKKFTRTLTFKSIVEEWNYIIYFVFSRHFVAYCPFVTIQLVSRLYTGS